MLKYELELNINLQIVCIHVHSFDVKLTFKHRTRFDVYETLCPNRCLYIKVAKIRTVVGSAEMS